MRSKREKRLRAIRREIVEPLNQPKEDAKLAALEAALAAPKLPVRQSAAATMDIATASITGPTNDMGIFLLLIYVYPFVHSLSCCF